MDSRGLIKWTSTEVSTQDSPLRERSYRASARLTPSNPVQRIVRLLHKHVWIITACLALTLSVSFLYALRQPRLYRATANIAIDRDSNTSIPLNKSFASALGDTDDYSVSLETQIRILESRSLALGVVRKLGLDHNAEFMRDANREFPSLRDASDSETTAVEALRFGLSVKPIKNTRVVELSFTGRDRTLNAMIVNTLVDAFIDDNIRSRYESANRAAKFLSAQLSELRTKVEESQQKLVAYEREHNIVMVDETQNVVTAKLDDLNKQVTAAEEDRMEKEAAYQAIAAGSLDRLPAGKSGEALENLYVREADLKNEYAQATTTYGPNHPKVLELTNRIRAMDASIQTELKRLRDRADLEYQVSMRREQKLRSAFETQKAEANRLKESTIQYGLLKRESDANRQLYDNLEERMKEAGVAAGLRSSNIRLIDPAQPKGLPVSPNLARAGYVGLFIAFLLSAAAIGLREGMNRALRDPAEVESFTAMPSLAIIPQHHPTARLLSSHVDNATQVVCLTEPRSATAEAYRALGTSILLASPELKTLLVSSPLPGEGKTMTAANAAVVIAQQGKRVLLVDADLRKPGLHREFGIANTSGLAEVLSDAVDEEGAIQQLERIANLSIIPAGSSQSMTAEMLGSAKMRELMQSWRAGYDYVILDTPPMLAVTDAVRLSSQADSVLVVIRSGQTSHDALARSCDLLNQASTPVLGIVVNGVSSRSAGSYYYGYYPQLAKGYYDDSKQA
ncbi:MAG TPA: polysaccharide biosynthesis tyrosine autokinase [Terriglobales bacterium]|jgi:succinoglycan biosynthesis transport protein ExoP|nr:polysaccharide biosynthesis tyrosine autokinase [Terriglobales bacterium]